MKRVTIELGLTKQEGVILHRNIDLKRVTILIDKIDGIKVDPQEKEFPTSILNKPKRKK